MSFSTFFSEQARKPAGLFGRLVMSNIFNIGNNNLNTFVYDLVSVQPNDHILEIGFGTGKLMHKMADLLDKGYIEGVDFSKAMVSIAQRKNRKHMANGKVKIIAGDFDTISFEPGTFHKVCSVNTLYFWQQPEKTARKIATVLEPGGKLVIAFEDIARLEKMQLRNEIFHLYTKDEVTNLLRNAGFSDDVRIESREVGSSLLHCAVAIK